MVSVDASGMATLIMSIQDASGSPVDIGRDVLRRSYVGLQQILRSFYDALRPAQLHPDELLAVSFMEPQQGHISFTLHVQRGPGARQPAALSPWRTYTVAPAPTVRDAAERTAGAVVDLVEAYSFVLAAREVEWSSVSGGRSVDLRDPSSGRRLRIPAGVGWALVDGNFDAPMREVLLALDRSCVATVSLSPGDGAPLRQLQQVAVATDAAVAFVSGGELPAFRALDGAGEDPGGPRPGSRPTPGA